MKIQIETIPHEKQRYPTVGDWVWDGETLKIRVSKLPDRRYESLVALHELIEVLLCREAGISQASVDAFDQKFELERRPGNCDEPGFDSSSPYRRQHTVATAHEMALAAELGVDWKKYEDALHQL